MLGDSDRYRHIMAYMFFFFISNYLNVVEHKNHTSEVS